MHGNTDNAIGVEAVESIELLRSEVVSLVLVADRKNDDIVLQKVDIVAFVRLLTHHSVESDVAAADQTILDWLLNVTARIVFVGCLVENVLGLFLLVYGFRDFLLNFFTHQFQL